MQLAIVHCTHWTHWTADSVFGDAAAVAHGEWRWVTWSKGRMTRFRTSWFLRDEINIQLTEGLFRKKEKCTGILSAELDHVADQEGVQCHPLCLGLEWYEQAAGNLTASISCNMVPESTNHNQKTPKIICGWLVTYHPNHGQINQFNLNPII